MPRRIAYAVGLAVAIALAGCYDIPQPECGFTCGPPAIAGGEGTCPEGYVCFTSLDNRCHRVSPAFTDPCPGDAAMPVDLTPPQVRFRSPAPNSKDVPISTVGIVEVGFTERVSGIMEFPNFIVEDPVSGMLLGQVNDIGSDSDGFFHYEFRTNVPFRSNTLHTVRLSAQITDFAGNSLMAEEWTFRTEVDDTPPTAQVTNPSMLTNVPVTTSIDVSFSEVVMNVTTATFTLTGPSGIVGANVSASAPGTTFAFLDPSASLLPNSQYTINLSSAITDLAGNPLTFTPITFTTAADIMSPMVSSSNPTSGSTNVSVLASVSAFFNESVTNVNGTTFTLTGPAGIEPAIVTSSATSGTLNPTHQLVPMTTYTFMLSTAIADLASNPLVAFTGTFTTGTDTFAPTVLARMPVHASTGVPVNTTVAVDFDENITNADGTTITLMGPTAVPATVTYQGAPLFRATLTPQVQLAANTSYMVLLASNLMDTSGNMFGTPPFTWMFTTGPDTIVPAVQTTSPADNATDVPLDATISVTFDEPVTGVDDTSFVVMNAGTGTLASSNGGRTWTFTPDAALPANTNITIMLTMAIEDAAGNDLVPFAFDFTTVP